MNKQRYRFNNETGKWDEVYSFELWPNAKVITGLTYPDGSKQVITVPCDSLLIKHFY